MTDVFVTDYAGREVPLPNSPTVRFEFKSSAELHDAIYALLTCPTHPNWHCFQIDHPYTLWGHASSRYCLEEADFTLIRGE